VSSGIFGSGKRSQRVERYGRVAMMTCHALATIAKTATELPSSANDRQVGERVEHTRKGVLRKFELLAVGGPPMRSIALKRNLTSSKWFRGYL
jgi:hypothetical protein